MEDGALILSSNSMKFNLDNETKNLFEKYNIKIIKKKRDNLYTKAFNLQNFNVNSVITLKNLTIKIQFQVDRHQFHHQFLVRRVPAGRL